MSKNYFVDLEYYEKLIAARPTPKEIAEMKMMINELKARREAMCKLINKINKEIQRTEKVFMLYKGLI